MYRDLEFNIPVGTNGDCFDRYLLRMAEMWESISIIEQCLENISQGSVKVEI